MKYIYIYTNRINGHTYIGQTNDIKKRHNCHKSDSYNTRSPGYWLPFHVAIRKYGIDNFTLEILEEVDTLAEADEREQYWIKEKKSLVSENGYNIAIGGSGCQRSPVPFEELITKGKLFSAEEIIDIQNRLIRGDKYKDIIDFYSPRLKLTFLSNINSGFNYKNPELNYPLKKDFFGEKGKISKEEIKEIKAEIKSGMLYSKIAAKHGIKSSSFISGVNTGRYYHDPNEKYPLLLKGCADKSWVRDCIYDLLYTDMTYTAIGRKYNRGYDAIKNLACGRAHKQPDLLYPLRDHLEENKKIFNHN